MLEGESEHSVRRVALHVLKSLSLARSLSQSLTRSGHVRPPRHVPLQKASERERQESCRGRKSKKGREGRGWRRKERGMRRAVGEETVKITERINTEDKAKQR